MTTEDRAYEAAARELVERTLSIGLSFDVLPVPVQLELRDHAKAIVQAFLTAMGQEVQ